MSGAGLEDSLFERIVAWAKAIAVARGADKLDAEDLVLGALKDEGGRSIVCELVGSKGDVCGVLDQSRLDHLSGAGKPVQDREFELTDRLRRILRMFSGGKYPPREILSLALESLKEEQWVRDWREKLDTSCGGDSPFGRLREIFEKTESLRKTLSSRLLGQDMAVDRVCDAYFNSWLRPGRGGKDDIANRGPRMVFTFLGPSGVGKTYMAEILASHIGGPEGLGNLLRLDMTAYAGHQAHEQLVGFSTAYSGATEGVLTGFAKDHPQGVVLIDGVEKAHRNTQNLFLELLDNGRLYDNNKRQWIDFSNLTVVFTTSLGQELYDTSDKNGFLRDTQGIQDVILDALRRSTSREREGSETGLAPELLSRLAKGHFVLFDRIDGLGLERIAEMTVRQVSEELEQTTGLKLEVAEPIVLTLLVLRFGKSGDARRLTTGLRSFFYDFLKELLEENRESLFARNSCFSGQLRGLRFQLSEALGSIPEAIRKALREKSNVLLIDDDPWNLNDQNVPFQLVQVYNDAGADQHLRKGGIDYVLMDLHIGSPPGEKNMDRGLELLRWLRTRFPDVPVYLFSESPDKRGLSPETLWRVSQQGGARGILPKMFSGVSESDGQEWTAFLNKMQEVDKTLRRQSLVEQYRRQLKVIDFDAWPRLDAIQSDGFLPVELRRVREVMTITAEDRTQIGWVEVPWERFDDVVVGEHTKQRLKEVVNWLRDPTPLRNLGVEMPKGILLTGPPGTGKTLLARVVAGESQVAFFALSAPDLISRFAGETEAAIASLFLRARRYAPALIFIDEIDAIGRRRTGEGSKDNWPGSVLNQLLVQMDGFVQSNRPVFVMAATNRPRILDPALVRPGRFDLEIEVPKPSFEARKAIFRLYLSKMKVADGIMYDSLAARAAGMTGADIRQICKEAGFMANREGSKSVEEKHLQEAITQVRMGLASEGLALDEETKWMVAVHESGHAVAQHFLFPSEPVMQLTILPRGTALGFMEHQPTKYCRHVNSDSMSRRIKVLLAGRVAEEVILGGGNFSAGCADDLESASEMATRMISAAGMDEHFGLLNLAGARMGLDLSDEVPLSEKFYDIVLDRSKELLAKLSGEVKELLMENKDALRRLAEAVRDRETLYEGELQEFLPAHK